MAKVVQIVGARGTGKSTVLKEVLEKVPNRGSIYLFDPNGDHDEFDDTRYTDFKSFIAKVNKLENAVVVVEEATIFINHFK